jgi:two-component system, cell cycle sensor histidine kinase and response regulator CckA
MSVDTTEKGVILIVDDTPTNLEMLLDFLEDSGFKVAVAEDGESAVEMAQYAPPDLILLDILMPGLDGFETCRRLKSNKATQDIPVIFMTALSEKVDKVKGLNLGAVDYIIKPLEHEEVLARVNIHLHLRNLTKRLTEQNERLEQEISERKRAESLVRGQTRVLEIIATGASLSDVLDSLARMIEEHSNGMLCSILLLDRNGTNLRHGAAPSLPEAYNCAVDGVAIGPLVGSCGTAAYLGKPIIVSDIASDPLWTDCRELALSHNLHACWSTPILSKNGSVLGTFAIYYREPKSPNPQELQLLEIATHIAGIAIERKRAEEEREQTLQKILEQAALLDITTDAILVRDLHNQIRYWNKSAEHLYGWTAQDAIGKNANELLYRRETLDQLENSWKTLVEQGSWQSELHQVTQEGKDIIVASRWTLVRDEDGQPESILTINTDITEKKQLEAQFLRTQRLESLGTLASGIAHDLNNALTPMMMTVQLLERKIPDEQSQHWLSILETNIKRAADLVKQVLSFSRGLEGRCTSLQVEQLISEIEYIAKQTFSKAIEIHTEIVTLNLWSICGNATQLHQVLMNLCVNARDAMPEGGTLQISARNLWIDAQYARMNIEAKVGPYVVITVSDTGIGIRNEVIDRIFEPFFTTKDVGKGTGLGLSTVIGIVKSHGGFVKVLSNLGKGTQFQVYLPAMLTRETNSPLAERDESPTGHGELILVVDDEDSIREITKSSLENYGYKVLTACDGIEAIALYTQHKENISVVLVDMMMPAIDGPTTIGVLRKINPQVKIIGVSGLVLNPKMIEHLGNSVKTFLPKPYTSDELLRNLQLVLSTN